MTATPPHPVALRFAQVIGFLRDAGADCGGRRLLAAPLTVRLWTRLGRMERQFAELLAHLMRHGADAPRRTYRKRQQPGALLPQDPPPAAAAGPVPPSGPPPVRPLRLPSCPA